MDTQPIKISIPTPCHEDWNKMTPNEQGSFCSQCSKTVVDFTQKSPDEITSILLEASNSRVCGRFMSNQLDEPQKQMVDLHVSLYTLPKNVSFSKAFVLALFIAFGTTLFSCSTYQNEMVGEIKIADTGKTVVEKTIDTLKTTGGKQIKKNELTPHEQRTLGIVCSKPNHPVVPDSTIHTQGDVEVVKAKPKPVIPLKGKVCVKTK